MLAEVLLLLLTAKILQLSESLPMWLIHTEVRGKVDRKKKRDRTSKNVRAKLFQEQEEEEQMGWKARGPGRGSKALTLPGLKVRFSVGTPTGRMVINFSLKVVYPGKVIYFHTSCWK